MIHRFSSSLSQTFSFEVEPLVPGGTVSGTVEVCGSRWLFKKPPQVMPLLPTVTVEKGFWDTRYSVFVTPDRDVRVILQRPSLS